MADSYIRVPPDSTGKKLFTQDHVVGSDTVQVQVIHAADPDNPNHIQHVDTRGAASVRFSEGSPLADGFGNLKTSQTRTIGAYDFTMDDGGDLWSRKIIGGAAITHLHQKSTVELSVGSAILDEAEIVTNHHHYYLPGTANTVMMTVALSDTGKAGCVRRWGLFDEYNGLFFKLNDDQELYCDIRSNVSGTVVHTKIPRSQWNGDKCDGNGLSGFTLDVSKLNIYFIDYQWLGAGRVRYGVIDEMGNRIVCHTMTNAGMNIYPYTKAGSFPVAINIENKAETSGPASIRLTCSSVHTEGNLAYTYWRYVHEFPSKAIATDTYLMALKSLITFGPNNAHNTVTGYPESIGLFVSGGPIKLTLYWDYYTDGNGAPIIGTPSWVDNDSTIVSDHSGTLDVTTGWAPKSWYLDAGTHNIDITDIFDKNDFGLDANGDGNEPVYVVLAATKLNGGDTVTVLGALNYAELK